MIRINLQTPENLSRNRAIASAVNAIRSRSYSERHPELEKMINCSVCDRRHRSSIVCVPKYYEIEYEMTDGTTKKVEMIADQTTRKGINGAAVFAKKRFLPHHNKWDLQLVQLTQQLFPQHSPYFSNAEDAMKEARKDAQRILKKKRNAQRKFKTAQQKIARMINFGLTTPGTRAANIHGTPSSRGTILERRKKQDERTKRNKEMRGE